MKLQFLILLFILGFKISLGQSLDTINWRPDYQLKFEDFKAKPDTTKIDLANSFIKISYDYHIANNTLECNVHCYFYKNLSWTKYYMPTLLRHEQGHFDLAELYALKLKEEFNRYSLNRASVQTDLETIYNRIINETYNAAKSYDKAIEGAKDETNQNHFIDSIRIQINKRIK